MSHGIRHRSTGWFWALFFLGVMSLPAPVYAQAYGDLTQEQVQRLKECERLLDGVSKETLAKRIDGLEQSRYQEEDLRILEAMARTYAEIVQEQQVIGQEKKEWLYNMIALNMAYLQMGGLDVHKSSETALNKLIQSKLRRYLPADLTNDQNMFYSLE